MPTYREAPPEPKQISVPSHFNSSTLPMEAIFLPAKDRMPASLRPVACSSKLVKMDYERRTPKSRSRPLVKPVGWVSPNTWDSRNYREIEGDYVDLVDIAKGNEFVDKQRGSHPKPSNSVLFKPVRPPPPVPLGNIVTCGHTLLYAEEPCTPCSQRKLGHEPTEQDLKCRYRDSYVAALRNPVAFERGSVDLLAALEEVSLCEEGELRSKGAFEAQRDKRRNFCNHCNKPVISNELLNGNSMPDPNESEGLNPLGKKKEQNIPLMQRDSMTCKNEVSVSPAPAGMHPHALREFVIKNLTLNQKNLNHIYYQTKLFTCKEFDLFALLKKHQKAIIFHQLFSLSCKPSGSRDRTGRAVVEVHGDRKDWMSPLVSAHNVCELLLYLHSIPRKEVRELGMTLVINARKKPPLLHLYKALLMEQALHAVHSIVMLVDKDTCPRPEKQPGLQMDIVTSMKALNKTVESSQLTPNLGGTFTYSHTDWLQFHQRLVSFMTDLRGADSLLQKAIKKVDGSKKIDSEVQQCIQEQRASMKEVLEDIRLVTLQREGGAILARMRREEFRFPQSEDYRDALESVTSLYNQVEEKLHTLVMRSNESLQHLGFLFRLREMEAKISTVIAVLSASALAKECIHSLEQVEQGCYSAQALSTLQMYEERLGGEFSTLQFQALKAKACAVGSGALGVMRVWNVAWVQCQEVRQRLQEKKEKGVDKNQIQPTTAANPQGDDGGIEKEEKKNEEGENECFLTQQPTSQKDEYHPELIWVKLRRIMEELLSTEREYVKALGYVREHYFPELERPDVPQDLRGQRGSIFGNLEKLHDFHRHHFLNELESCVNEPFRVGRCFLRHRESFALYALYSKNKPQSDNLLINHGQAFFKQKQLKLGDKMDLWSYLLKPVQRISKYSLLLQDMMMECGPGQTREMAEVKAALEVIHFQLRHGNNLLAMDAINHCDVNLKEQGQLIRQDEFLVTFRKKKCLRHIFLFQELILFSKTRKTDVGNETYIYKQSFKFESGILDICLRILDMNPKCLKNPGKDCSGRRNPIYVSRVLSAMVNCNDDKGVLLGKWTDGYEGGVSPMFWRGSVEILRNWDTQACQPVRYGQCWVFAAVACSISRALGIPCRVVTNYHSAHDSNSDLVIERYINENGEPIQSREMIWNYHCWVENWMTRPDLKSDFNGWQASDPTPQEKSEGVYCCGPIPVRAIKEGELVFKYDAPFVFAEVNADVITIMKKKDGNTSKVTSTAVVGQKISTKSVDSDAREDITHLYKYPEGSDEEREAFKKANHQNKLLQQQENEGLHITIKVSSEMRKGCDFDVFAVVTNNTQREKKCRLVFGSCAMSYNGFLGKNCGFKDLLNVELSPGEERRVPLRLNYSKYGVLLTEDNLIRLAVLLMDYSTGETTLVVRNIVLDNPEIKVRILGEPKENRKLAAEITLKNPLPEPLENCCFSIEGANLTAGTVISERLGSSVGPGEDAKVKIYFTPTHSGLRKLVVDFDSSKLCHVKGYRNVIIGK
uniref:protein-glutamine gamma-glutamyltransferase n=1 Tax=Sander lucioperca TaxID=283035 RepID=A0A8C9X0R8_SANLU